MKVNTFLRQLLNIKTNNAGSKNTDIINKKHLPKTKGYVWIHRENKNTLIPESLLDDYLNKG